MLDIKLLKSPHPFHANSYLISFDGEYAIIDPTAPFDNDLICGELKYILLTHGHFDHILEIDSWVENTNASVIISEDEISLISNPDLNCYRMYNGTNKAFSKEVSPVKDGDKLILGNTNISVLSTPGHTLGSVVYLIDDVAFVGDTVFKGGGYGRYDLPTGNALMLRQSIDKISSLDESIKMYPGHGGSTTVKEFKFDFYR